MSPSRLIRPPVPPAPHADDNLTPPPALPPPSSRGPRPPPPTSPFPSLAPQRAPAGPASWIARILCLLFAVVGALPFALAVLLDTESARSRASQELSKLLDRELGIGAVLQVAIHPWPLTVTATRVRIDSTDGSGPAIEADRITVQPKIFALLQGQIDAGEIEIERPRARLVVRDGELANLRFRSPSKSPDSSSTRAPFSSLGVTDASVSLLLDGVSIRGSGVDLDLAAEEGPSFEVALHAGTFSVDRSHRLEFAGPDAPAPSEARDEDVLCNVDGRVRVTSDGLLVRRLRVAGAADLDPAPGTSPGCALAADDPRQVRLEVRNTRVDLANGGLDGVAGTVKVRAPLRVANRFATMMPLDGWTSVEVDASWKRGKSLPDLRGSLEGRGIAYGRYRLASDLSVGVRIEDDVVSVPRALVGFADGRVEIRDFEIRPLAPGIPLKAASLTLQDLQFPGLMRDLGVTEHTHVKMHFKDGTITQIAGTIDPLRIDSDLVTHVADFEVLDAAFDDPASAHVIGVRQATVHSRFVVTPKAVEFQSARADFGRSHLTVATSLGFHNDFRLSVGKGSHVELADITPLLDIPWSGSADLSTEITGVFNDPLITAELSIGRFEFAGFSFGDVQGAKVRFKPLALEFSDVRGRKNGSYFRVPTMRLDFNGPAPMLMDAEIESQALELRDFLAVLRFDSDPRFLDMSGAARTQASLHYEIGGPQDRCGGGFMSVRARAHFDRLDLFGETYDEADADLDYRSTDRDAQDLGIEIDIRSAQLRKGNGTLLATGTVRNGGVVRVNAFASDLPLNRIQSIGQLGSLVDATVSATADVRGTLDRLEVDVDARMTPLRFGRAVLPESRVAVRLVPIDRPVKLLGRTRCGLPIPAPFDPNDYAKDPPLGVFHATGQLFGGQLSFEDLRVTRQRSKSVLGSISANKLDLGALARARSSPREGESPFDALLSGRLDIRALELDSPERADLSLAISSLHAASSKGTVRLREGTHPVVLSRDTLALPEILLDFSSNKGLSGTVSARGQVRGVMTHPELDLEANLLPLDISALSGVIPKLERASGKAQGRFVVAGPLSSPRSSGEFTLRNGSMSLHGLPVPIEAANVDLRLDEREIRLERATARIGGGSVSVVGTMPVKGFDFGTAVATMTARNVSLPLVDGVHAIVDADLSAAWSARLGEQERSIPRVVGDVTLVSFDYTRPIAINADIGSLGQRGRRTRFETYDPEDDFLSFEVRLRAAKALRLRNNMADMQLLIDSGALTLSGTNQRMGLRGGVRVKPGGRLRLRQSEFEIRNGSVRFDDPTRIAPVVDVTAVTEYRRYSQAQGQTGAAGGGAVSGAGTAGAVGRTGGQWRIQMRAHGDAENLRLDLTSEPGLSQEDIVLLLTFGVTRAELDQMQASNIGGTAAIEALSTLTGADSAVRGAIPVIDDFRLGTAYSSRTGRTEPTVTVGKRITERVRANVTSGLAENREVRSNVEWQLTPRTSVLGSYDNVNSVSSSAVGNLGADMRFRIEFE